MGESSQATDFTWRIREPAPGSPWRACAGVALVLFAVSPFLVAGLAVLEPTLVHFLDRAPALVMIWWMVAPWFAGFMLRAAIPMMYPAMTNWLPPTLVRIGVWCGMLTCVLAIGIAIAMVGSIGWRAALGLLPLFLLFQLAGVLRLPQLQRVHAEIENVYL